MTFQHSEKSAQVPVKREFKQAKAAYLHQPLHLQLNTGDEYTNFRQKWWQWWLPKDPPPPAPPSLEDAVLTPLADASIFSQLTFTWITGIMVLGYQRTLQASDLYKMDTPRQSAVLAAKLEAAWQRRVKAAADWNARLENGELRPSLFKRTGWALRAICCKGQMQGTTWSERRAAFRKHWRESEGRKEASLTWALNDVFRSMFWIGGVFKAWVFSDTAQVMSPIVLRQIIVFAQERSAAIIAGESVPNVGRGIAMALGLFVLTVTAGVCSQQYFWRSMATGVLVRAALITCVYERGVNLTGKARVKLNNAALINHISTDVSRIDVCTQGFHAAWAGPIQVILCLIILLAELGPSALTGFSLFVLVIPFQMRLMTLQHRIRLGSMKWTDQRAKVLLEVLGTMRVIKYFSYEVPFFQRILELRKKELHGIRRILHSSSASLALALSLPVLAATVAFVTYSLTAHNFNVAAIFSSLSLFQILREPMLYMPRALSAISDASSAIQRLTHIFHAELIPEDALVINEDQQPALLVKDATFEWESFEKDFGEALSSKKGAHGDKSAKEGKAKDQLAPEKDVLRFRVKNVNMTIPRGQLVAVVGPVGSGKSSLLQGLIGEMRKVSGHVSFGGRLGYCPQTAWIQNATLRDNITFGRPFEEDRYWRVLETTCLLPDLQLLPDGDLTEIGEKGINLSGGQKQRVNIARALYFDPEIVIFDDPLSAVDAHVGKSLFQDAIVGALRNRGVTVILVTHAIHFLSQVDYIYTLNNGVITDSGTYDELISRGGDFARLDLEFGGHASEWDNNDQAEEVKTLQAHVTIDDVKLKSERARERATGSGKVEGHLIVKEKRTTGSVSWKVYWTYLVAGRSSITGPLVLFSMLAMQGSQILNSYTLVWWESNKFERPNSFYQTLYGCLGVAQAIFTFFLGVGMDLIAFYVSQNLHHKSLHNVFYASMSFFDTTPMGRILSVFGKDIDSIDNQLANTMRAVVMLLSAVMSAIIIVAFLEPYFVIAVFFILIGYSYYAAFYRASAREVKRLDSMLRSLLYAHFSETLTGLPTIRSYGEMKRFIAANRYYVDLENRALYIVVTNQRWLAIRLDLTGSVLVFFVALLAVTDVSGVNAAQIGLVLTYTIFLTQTCTLVIRQTADVENNMNAVERREPRVLRYFHSRLLFTVVQYVDEDTIPQEAPHEIEERKPPTRWPEHGAVEFNDIKMSYRPGLSNVLRGISIKGQGRTGAGKSSLMLAAVPNCRVVWWFDHYRWVRWSLLVTNIVVLTLSRVDISTIGLKDLRSKISIIPQDPLLFSGTIRSNLDPFAQHDDAELWDALHRSCLINSSTTSKHSSSSDGIRNEQTSTGRYDLDNTIESEGANLSVGERSLLSLARALVKDCKVVVLDEATASVDLETDSKIQHTIQTEFKDHTLLCIAHRLRTIISYDRILVLDAGLVAEFDTPSNLFKVEGGIFRGMCEKSNISLKDIEASMQV
ncbi:ABC protein [Suillus paluster]|uniref:ABC protein n=1 Tax=Suillus paluster TaxID=48578 RepID=UPI001B87DD48|nr:ABC protein [Suillus paluster]KAG1748434.1 ABC protein [Suillus paluster]